MYRRRNIFISFILGNIIPPINPFQINTYDDSNPIQKQTLKKLKNSS